MAGTIILKTTTWGEVIFFDQASIYRFEKLQSDNFIAKKNEY
jgi:hypothetical protein